MFCEYRDLFGVPEKGLHSIRILDVAVIDTLATLLVGTVIAYYTGISVWVVWLGLFLLGIIAHRLFCVNTTINKALFGTV